MQSASNRTRNRGIALLPLRAALPILLALSLFGTSCASSASLSSGSQSSDSISNGLGSVSKSLKSISRSIKSVSRSISRSSSKKDKDKKESYRSDVRIFTTAFLRSGGESAEFQRDLSAIARRYGVTFWEREPATFRGIGEGMKEAGVSSEQWNRFLSSFATDEKGILPLIRAGYEAG